MSLIGMLRPLWRNSKPKIQYLLLAEVTKNNGLKSNIPCIKTLTSRYLCSDINNTFNENDRESGIALTTHRLLVEDMFVSGLIGRAGNVIGGIRKQSGCSIKIEDHIDEETCKREVSVYGPSKDVDVAKELIESRLDTLRQRYQETGKSLATKHMLVDNEHIGAVIGQRGSNITKIRVECDCQVRIARQPQPGTNNRAVVISGDPAEVEKALRMVQDSIENRYEE